MYYLGNYAEIDGAIFTRSNIRLASELPEGLRNFRVFCDPSALRGADWFACVLSATDKDGNVWIIDTYSVNTGTREAVARRLRDWCRAWDVKSVHIETNGLVGIDFYEFAQNSGLPVDGWYSRGNKYQRIVDNYQNITTQMYVLDTEANRAFLEQVYQFDEKCEHDDNIDAINSSFNLQRWTM
jgi:predicted phage terminase large subunit-like protein